MNLNPTQTRFAGVALLAFGVASVFNLWWAIPIVLLAAGGIAVYQRQRAAGRTGEAVQAALWGVGLALLLLLDFVFPGVLLLGGVSLLLRGREGQADQRIQAVLATLKSRSSVPSAPPSIASVPSVPAAPSQTPRMTIVTDDQTSTGETVRLR